MKEAKHKPHKSDEKKKKGSSKEAHASNDTKPINLS